MSGGSFNYLYNVFAVGGLDGLLLQRGMILAMAEALKDYHSSDDAIKQTKKIFQLLEDTTETISNILDEQGLAEVWHMVEWHIDSDTSRDSVQNALLNFNHMLSEGIDPT